MAGHFSALPHVDYEGKLLPAAVNVDVPHPADPPAQDQQAAVDAAFTDNTESRLVAEMLGMWVGGMLLYDVAVEQFSPPANEEDDGTAKKEDDEEPEEEE